MGVVYEEPRTWASSGEQAEHAWVCVSRGATVDRHATGHGTQPGSVTQVSSAFCLVGLASPSWLCFLVLLAHRRPSPPYSAS